jgi:hypothetical protein
MAIKRWEQAGINDVARVWETIRGLAAGKLPISPGRHSPRTCWVAVGAYLLQHQDTVGTVWFYGAPGSQVNDAVSHVMLTDKAGNVLRDTQKARGGHQLDKGSMYQSPDIPGEPLELMAWKKWP